MDVRRAVAGDEDRLRAIRLEALADSPHAFASSYEREVTRTADDWRRWIDAGATFFGVAPDGEPVGLVAVVPERDDPSVLRLVSMWLHPAQRGTGAADELMAAALEWAEAQDCRTVRLCVIEGNVAARRVYERHGFGLVSVCGSAGQQELTMERPRQRLGSGGWMYSK